MDLYVKLENLELDIIFDLVLENNDLIKDDSYLTASLLSIFTDGSKRQIGTQLNGDILGNINYNINKLSEENIKLYETGLFDALSWLIDDGIVLSISIETEKIGNRLNIKITFINSKGNPDNLIYSLDENMSLLD